MRITRRQLLADGAVASAAFLGLRRLDDWFALAAAGDAAAALVPDPAGMLELPPGFSYATFSRTGERMSDGLLVPAAHDGMAAFPAPGGRVLLVRNHEGELSERSAFPHEGPPLGGVDSRLVYDTGGGSTPGRGGTTTLVYDPKERRLERHFLSLAGTYRNCAGGPTPWGSWLSCEESVASPGFLSTARAHGYAFEVPARADSGLVEPVPLVAMGRFRREAAAVDPRTGFVYQTEDRGDGLLYRFQPAERGRLARGGRLQALRIRDAAGADTSNAGKSSRIARGERLAVDWVNLDEVEAPLDDLRLRGRRERGAAIFSRGEGIWYAADGIYFTATNGGPSLLGQIWRYAPSPEGRADTLELIVESTSVETLQGPDNLTIAPWGELFVCEDGAARNHIRRVTRDGRVRTFARAVVDTEFAGGAFSPDASTFFVNLQDAGLTAAITGPWEELRASAS